MYHNITQRLAEKLAHRNKFSSQNAKSINEQLLQMITNIRSLEDQLLAEQYRHELLLQQNQSYKTALEKYSNTNEMQQQKIKKLDSQMNLHHIKNNELQMCEDSLKAIYQEIHALTSVVENRSEECELLGLQKGRIAEENSAIRQNNFQMSEKHELLVNEIVKYLDETTVFNGQMKPTLCLRSRIYQLKDQMAGLQIEESKVRREGGGGANVEKGLLIKLQFQQQLLLQRGEDYDKIEQLANICKNQQDIEKVVEEMLAKEDDLKHELTCLERQNRGLKNSYSDRLFRLRNQWEDENQQLSLNLRQYRMEKERVKSDLKQTEHHIQTKTERYRNILQQHQVSLQLDVNLASLKRMRQAEEKNKHLKLRINELLQTKSLLAQQKELLHPDIVLPI